MAFAVVVLLLACAAPPVYAIDWQRTLSQACTYAGNIQGFSWLCSIQWLIMRYEYLQKYLAQDLVQFAKGLAVDLVRTQLGALAGKLGLTKIDQAVNQLYQWSLSFPANLQLRVRQLVGQLTLDKLWAWVTGRSDGPQGSPTQLVQQATRGHPNLAAAKLVNEGVQETVANIAIRAAAYQEHNAVQVEQQANDAKEGQDQYIANLMGNPLAGKQGLIDQIKEKAKTADSTRAAVQYLTEAVADLIGAQAQGLMMVADRLDQMLQQQVMTTSQLSDTVQLLALEQNRKAQEFEAALEQEMAAAYEEGEQAAEVLNAGQQALFQSAGPVMLR